MLLKNLTIAGKKGTQNIHIENGDIVATTIGDRNIEGKAIVFDNDMAFPGLINSHDHLDFNLFAQLGDGIYNNYTEWANDIHKKYKNEIAAVLKIPQSLRVQWGMYKNLLAGITTVVNHGEKLVIENEFIGVLQNAVSLHSSAFEKGFEKKLKNALNADTVVVMHIGEGTDKMAAGEINKIIKLNDGKRNIVAVHGVAMNTDQAANFRALVWCPDSNYFLLGSTAQIKQLKRETVVLFGSDSTLSSVWNIWEHIRLAKGEQQLSNEELLNSLTINAANTWEFRNIGSIAPQMQADIVIAKNNDDLFATDPENILLVLKLGKVRLFDASVLEQLKDDIVIKDFSGININGHSKYVYGDLPGLMKVIKQYYPAAKFPIQPNN
jgi:cytosine/adenosine deaminase-related metal-dependent hydrolase